MENTNTLVNRLGQGVVRLVEKRLTGFCWDRLVRLGDTKSTSTLAGVSTILGKS